MQSANKILWVLNKPVRVNPFHWRPTFWRTGKCLLTVFVLLICLAGRSVDGQESKRYTAKVTVNGKVQIGWPIVADKQGYVLLRRDGSIKQYSFDDTSGLDKISNQFTPYPVSKYVQRLGEVFGKQYEVSQTRHFVVVYPRGQRDRWTLPLEKLYSAFDDYFAARGLRVNQPEFPLIAVIFRTRKEYDAYTLKQGVRPNGKVVGLYFQNSNRFVTFDQSGTRSADSNLATIIHEATHQVAFNTGVQNRYAPPPVWAVEGIAMMFETMGIGKSIQVRWQDRVNRPRLQNFKSLVKNGKFAGVLGKLLTNDEPFRTSPDAAYSVAWALSFYLAEARPADFARYMKHMSRRKSFTQYSSNERLKDFARYFGSNFDELVRSMEAFYANYK